MPGEGALLEDFLPQLTESLGDLDRWKNYPALRKGICIYRHEIHDATVGTQHTPVLILTAAAIETGQAIIGQRQVYAANGKDGPNCLS